MPKNKPTKTKFLKMPLADIYFICQMVDRSLKEMDFARNIEEFMGDMACVKLLNNYPKFTPFHEYIEEVVSNTIWEEREVDISSLIYAPNRSWSKKLWVDNLLEAHGFQVNFIKWSNGIAENTVELYLEYLQEEGIFESLTEAIAKEAFHVLFANRKVLNNFCEHAAHYVQGIAFPLYPEKFNKNGGLKRTAIPQWVKNAVFHRDKGLCAQCKADLTRLINQQNALHYDHVIPLVKGGINDITNLQLLCEKCNLKKSDHMASTSISYESWYAY